nr:hypothetical protein [Kocuria rhizophila]
MTEHEPKTYRKKPVTVEAMQVTADPDLNQHIQDWAARLTPPDKVIPVVVPRNGIGMLVHTLEGTLHARSGDYIIRGVAGEFYPCDLVIFHQTYEEATA